MSKLSIKRILQKLDRLNKSNPLKYMISGSKNEKIKFCRMGEKKHYCNNFC